MNDKSLREEETQLTVIIYLVYNFQPTVTLLVPPTSREEYTINPKPPVTINISRNKSDFTSANR